MKLYVLSKKTNRKIYLKRVAPTRSELRKQFGTPLFKIGGEIFNIKSVYAEKDMNNAATGMALGGVVGLVGGVPGVVIGGIIGGLFGKSADDKEQYQVERFNGS